MSEPENFILALLREMRAEQQAFRDEVNARFDQVEARFDARFTEMDKRLDQMHANGLKALQQFIGHRAMAERTVASIVQQLAVLEERVDRLESARA